MVVLNKIYTRTGDDGTTALATGDRRPKDDPRIDACGAVDETNAAIGIVRSQLAAHRNDQGRDGLDAMLAAIQNDLFDLGAELATPEGDRPPDVEPLRILPAQIARLETEIDTLNAGLKPLRSFVLPGGTPAAAALHLARTIARRAERRMVSLAAAEPGKVGAPALRYVNRLSDFLFVASRHLNDGGAGDVLWEPGATRGIEAGNAGR